MAWGVLSQQPTGLESSPPFRWNTKTIPSFNPLQVSASSSVLLIIVSVDSTGDFDEKT